MYSIAILRQALENKEISVDRRDYKDISSEFIPQRIFAVRQSNRLSRNVFAETIGVTAKSVANWECGLTIPTGASLERICNAFDLENSYFERI